MWDSIWVTVQPNINQAVVLAFCGGIALDFLYLFELPNIPPDRRPNLRSPIYWLQYFFWPILGGFLGFIYDENTHLSRVVAFQIGLSAPLIIRSLANIIPSQIRQPPPPPPGA
jgi:hypothetical protein